jgi:hypothetical protein
MVNIIAKYNSQHESSPLSSKPLKLMVNKIANHRYMYHPSSKRQTDMVNNITNYNNMICSSETILLRIFTPFIGEPYRVLCM